MTIGATIRHHYETQSLNPRVRGSSPRAPTNKINDLRRDRLVWPSYRYHIGTQAMQLAGFSWPPPAIPPKRGRIAPYKSPLPTVTPVLKNDRFGGSFVTTRTPAIVRVPRCPWIAISVAVAMFNCGPGGIPAADGNPAPTRPTTRPRGRCPMVIRPRAFRVREKENCRRFAYLWSRLRMSISGT